MKIGRSRKKMKIGCSDYSFRHEYQKDENYYMETFPEIAAKIGIKGLELIDGHLEKYLPDIEVEDIKAFQDKIKSKYGLDICAITGFNIGIPWSFGHVWEEFSIDNIKHVIDMHQGVTMDWLDICGELKIPNMRFDAGGFHASHKVPIYDAIDLNIEIYKRILTPVCEKSNELGVKVGVENHGYFTADIKVLQKMLDAVPHLYVTCDTGNWPFASRLDDIRTIADKVNFMHAKTHVFNDDGAEKNIDFEGIVEIMDDAGFDGWWSIEWEGPTLSDEQGVQKTYDLLTRYS